MIRAMFYDPETQHLTSIKTQDLPLFLQRGSGCLWLDIQQEPQEIVERILRDVFDFHPLAIEDAVQQIHVPKIDDWQDYIYIALHAVRPDAASADAPTSEVDVFIGKHYLVTARGQPTAAVDRVWNKAEKNRLPISRGPAHVLYAIIDEAEADFASLFDDIDEQVSRIEDTIFTDPSRFLLAELFGLKRTLIGLRRILSPQREVIGRLARGAFEQFSVEETRYFHDVYDHMLQLGDLLESLRDIVSSVVEIYLSAASNRLNDVLKTLTVITTLFMPLTFIAGFFGMNFFRPTEWLGVWTEPTAFVVTLLVMIATPVVMYMWIRRRGWL